ncbi:MAG: Ig-like domain-containing protein, partial [archaeon]|nr:Ig-like domain-containing protein [archaeon]
MRKRIIGIALLAILSLALFSQIALAVNVTYVRVVRGQEVTINLGTRTISANAGLFGIKIGSVTYYGYCIDIFHRAGTGSASLEAPPDTGEWEDEYQSIAYIMAWYTPTPPTSISDFEAASVQAAIWRFLFPPPLGVISPSSVVNRAIEIYDDAFGKDAIRGTSLELTFDTSSYPPNIDVIAQIDQLRDGVKIIFSATGGTLSDTVAFTDSFGTAKVTLSPPSPWTGPITVTAYTMGIKNFKIVNMVSDTRQDLIIGEPFEVSDSESIIPLAEVYSIYGYKWNDSDGDGVKDGG